LARLKKRKVADTVEVFSIAPVPKSKRQCKKNAKAASVQTAEKYQ